MNLVTAHREKSECPALGTTVQFVQSLSLSSSSPFLPKVCDFSSLRNFPFYLLWLSINTDFLRILCKCTILSEHSCRTKRVSNCMTSASELFFTRRSRYGRTDPELGSDSLPGRISHHHSIHNRRRHHHNHQQGGNNIRRDRLDASDCEPLHRSPHRPRRFAPSVRV